MFIPPPQHNCLKPKLKADGLNLFQTLSIAEALRPCTNHLTSLNHSFLTCMMKILSQNYEKPSHRVVMRIITKQ